MIIIIIEFCSSSTIKIYITFQDLYIIINIYASKENYTITIKHFKKNRKKKLQKV